LLNINSFPKIIFLVGFICSLSFSISYAYGEPIVYDTDDTIESLTINVGDVLQISPNTSIYITKKIDNFGIIENDGTIRIGGRINNYISSALNNNVGGIIENTEGGTINTFVGSIINNKGKIENEGTINVFDDGTLYNMMEGTITNVGIIINSGGVMVNEGSIDNKIEATISNQDSFINKGEITNSGEIINEKILSNNDDGVITNLASGKIINKHTIGNFGGTIINIAGTIVNNNIITNEGTIYNCEGTIEGEDGVMSNSIIFDCDTSKKNEDDSNSISSSSGGSGSNPFLETDSETSQSSNNLTKEQILDGVKKKSGLWAGGLIGNSDYVNSIRSIIDEGIVSITDIQHSSSGNEFVPGWFQNTAGWWFEGLISEDEFINAVKFLVEKRVIRI